MVGMNAEVALGIDVGTTRVKAAVVGLDGTEQHVASAPTPWQLTADGTLVDVAELGDVALRVAGAAGDWALAAGASVCAIGVTGMAETGALLDGAGRALAPGFAWHNTQGFPAQVQDAFGAERFNRTTGRDCTIAPSIVKLDLLRRRGHVFAPGEQWLNIPDYIAFRLSGVRAAEISLACRTGLVDIAARDWWDDALAFLGAGRWLLPGELIPGGTVLGTATGEVPPSLRGARVATAGHDHPVAALGVGSSAPGELVLSLGTAEAQLRFVDPPLPPAIVADAVALGASVDWHPLGDRLTVLRALPTGITLGRLADAIGCGSTADRLQLSERALDERDSEYPRVAAATFDSFSIEGIGDGVTPERLWRNAVAGVIGESGHMMRRVAQLLGPWRGSTMFGGWIHDPLAARLRREQLGEELRASPVDEAGAVGAALLAAGMMGDTAVTHHTRGG